MTRPSRSEARAQFDNDTRVTLLESDADALENAVVGLKQTISKLTWSVVGAALSLTTASILLAVNLSLINGGG